MLLLVAFLSQSVSFQRGGNVVATLLAPCFSELFFGWAFTQKKNFRKHKRAATSLNISGPPLVERM